MKPVWAWVAAVTALRVAGAAIVPVLPEEAYHWNYARHPDWSYLDHPPLIAWSIAAGRLVFGDTRLGIRAAPLLLAFASTVVLARLARRLYGDAAAAWSVVLMASVPALAGIAVAGYPDSPLICFWILALAAVWRAIESGRGAWWLAAGAAAGAALLSKYTAVLLGVSILGHLLFSPRDRRWLATPWPWLALLAALAMFSPVLWWNSQHDWASFRMQSVERLQQARGLSVRSGLTFIAGQWLVHLPLTLPLAAVAVRQAIRSPRPEDRFLLWSAVPTLLLFGAVAWARTVHLLWPIGAYPGLALLMAGASGRLAAAYRTHAAWLAGATATIAVLAGVHAAFFLPALSPMKGLYGWAQVSQRARDARSTLGRDAFYVGIGRKYTCTSQLAFHLAEPQRVYGKHVLGFEGLQYEYWSEPCELAGRDAVIVIEDGDRTAEVVGVLRSAFESAHEAEVVQVPVGRRTVLETPPLRFFIWIGRRYRGPPSPHQRSSTPNVSPVDATLNSLPSSTEYSSPAQVEYPTPAVIASAGVACQRTPRSAPTVRTVMRSRPPSRKGVGRSGT